MNHSIQLLLDNMAALHQQIYWLQRSFSICQNLAHAGDLSSPEAMDAFETLCSRFARSVDNLIRKLSQ